MHKLISLLMVLTFNSYANNHIEECKKIGENAYKIMMERQKNKPLLEVYESYQSEEDKKIVIDAYKEPHHDLIGQLNRSINSFGKRSHAEESRKYDEVEALFNNTTEGFRNKYIFICLNSYKQ